MPALVAHFKFGQWVFSRLDDEIKAALSKNIHLFGLGSQGPDLLFHSNTFKKDVIAYHGIDIHHRPAADIFELILRSGKAKTSKMLAYTLGVCCHYVLDAVCHPFIDSCVGDHSSLHISLESDLESAVIEKFNMSTKREIYLPRSVDYHTVAEFYGITTQQARRCLVNFRLNTMFLGNSKLIDVAEFLLKKDGEWKAFTLKPTITFKDEVAHLMFLTEEALVIATSLVTELFYAIKEDLPLPPGFEKDFNGSIV